MSVLFARAVVVPVWMILFALIALLAPPFGATTGLLQLLGLALAVSALLAFMVSAVRGPVPHTYTPSRNSYRSVAFDRCGFMDRGCHA